MNNQPFSVSRMNTDFGVFRISGSWCSNTQNIDSIVMTSIEIMGTDGWVLLVTASEQNVQLIHRLQPLLLRHLQSK
ncbi:hypothetical protein ACXJY6_00550 [Vibrio sp. RC27]